MLKFVIEEDWVIVYENATNSTTSIELKAMQKLSKAYRKSWLMLSLNRLNHEISSNWSQSWSCNDLWNKTLRLFDFEHANENLKLIAWMLDL